MVKPIGPIPPPPAPGTVVTLPPGWDVEQILPVDRLNAVQIRAGVILVEPGWINNGRPPAWKTDCTGFDPAPRDATGFDQPSASRSLDCRITVRDEMSPGLRRAAAIGNTGPR